LTVSLVVILVRAYFLVHIRRVIQTLNLENDHISTTRSQKGIHKSQDQVLQTVSILIHKNSTQKSDDKVLQKLLELEKKWQIVRYRFYWTS